MKKLMLVAAIAAGFGLIAEQSFAAPPARGRSTASHSGAHRAPARSHATPHRAAPAHRGVATPVRRHVAPAVVRPRIVAPVRRPVIVNRYAPVIRRPYLPAIGIVAPVYGNWTVSYQMYGVHTLSQLNYAAAVDAVNELQALGARAEIRSGFGGYDVVYDMFGAQTRTFGSRDAAIDFETRLAQLGMQVTLL
jgi:hypothetical protein